MEGFPPREEDPLDPELDARYEAAVNWWLGLRDAAEIEAGYRERVFPLALARMVREAASRAPVEFLLLPVGTQAYSPRLVVEGMPAAAVGMLATPGTSHEIAEKLATLLGERGVATDVRLLASHGVSREEVAELAVAVYRTAGEPDPRRTVVDLTSGRKPTTAALATVADTLGAGNCYLEAAFHRPPHGGYATRERLLVSAPLELRAVSPALEAPRALAREGLFGEAARYLGRRARGRYMPPQVRAARHLFALCQHLVEENPRRAAASLRRAVGQLRAPSPFRETLAEAYRVWGVVAREDDLGALGAALAELRRLVAPGVRPRLPAVRPDRRLRPVLRPVLEWLMGRSEAP